MLSGRTWVVLGMIGLGAYVLNRGQAIASGVHGLGDAVTPDQAAALAAQLSAAEAHIQTINQLLIVIPPTPQFGPTKVLA